MAQIIITSPTELDAWLREHGYFVEQYCWSVASTIQGHPAEHAGRANEFDTVSFELAYQVGGGWMVDEPRIMRVFACRAERICEWTPDARHDAYMDEGVEQLDAGDALGLNLDRNGRLICGRLIVEQLPDRPLRNEPKPDPSLLVAWVPDEVPPTPGQWLDWLREAGEDAVWRVYGGAEWSADRIPTDDYSAFLQYRHDIPDTAGGVFVEVRKRQDGTCLMMSTYPCRVEAGSRQERLWRQAREMLLTFPQVTIRSGNCPFNNSQWRLYLASGLLPDYESVAT